MNVWLWVAVGLVALVAWTAVGFAVALVLGAVMSADLPRKSSSGRADPPPSGPGDP